MTFIWDQVHTFNSQFCKKKKKIQVRLGPQIILPNRYTCNGVQVSGVDRLIPIAVESIHMMPSIDSGLGRPSLRTRKTMPYFSITTLRTALIMDFFLGGDWIKERCT